MALLESDESERLETLHSSGLPDTAKFEDFDQITRLAAFCLNALIALILLVDRDRQQFLSEAGPGIRETTREAAICAHAIKRNCLFSRPIDPALILGFVSGFRLPECNAS